MVTKKESLDRQRTEVAKRLREILEEKHMKQATLRRETSSRFDRQITAAQLSQIIHGDRTLQQDFCRMFSDILEIEAGYLLGADNFAAHDYHDYILHYGSEASAKQVAERAEKLKYNSILHLIGYEAYFRDFEPSEDINDSGETVLTLDPFYYVIDSKGHCAYIPVEELERFQKNISLLAKEMMRPLMRIYHTDPPDWM